MDPQPPEATSLAAEPDQITTAASQTSLAKVIAIPLELRLEIYSHLAIAYPTPIISRRFGVDYEVIRILTLPHVCKQFRAEVEEYLRPHTHTPVRVHVTGGFLDNWNYGNEGRFHYLDRIMRTIYQVYADHLKISIPTTGMVWDLETHIQKFFEWMQKSDTFWVSIADLFGSAKDANNFTSGYDSLEEPSLALKKRKLREFLVNTVDQLSRDNAITLVMSESMASTLALSVGGAMKKWIEQFNSDRFSSFLQWKIEITVEGDGEGSI